MNTTPAEIEAIVRLVVERLQAAAVSRAVVNVETSATSQAGSTHAYDPTVLSISAPLVTLEQLRGKKFEGIRTVEVVRRAVVTPAVRDELRLRGIQLRRARPVFPARPAPQILLIAPATKSLGNVRVSTEQTETSAASDAQRVLEHLSAPERRVVWCSQTPFAAHQALCGTCHIRAAMLFSLGDLQRAESEIEPNVLVLDDRRWSLADLNTLVNQWQAAV